MVYENVITLLKELHADSITHSNRTLLDHLKGTFHLLTEWHQPNDVTLAGLCHSLYSTSGLGKNILPISRREVLQEVIGINAEKLVYLNSALPKNFWQRIISQSYSYFFFLNRWNAKLEEIPHTDFIKLATMEFANRIELLLEQFVRNTVNQQDILEEKTFFIALRDYLPTELQIFGMRLFKLEHSEQISNK